jgi:hypothetical protein
VVVHSFIQGDLRHINGLENFRSRKEELVIFGGPPCQAFSTSNQRNRGPSNVRNFLFRDFLKFVQAQDPRPKPLGGDRRSGRIDAHRAAVVAALGPDKDATLEEVRLSLAAQGLAFGFGTIQ